MKPVKQTIWLENIAPKLDASLFTADLQKNKPSYCVFNKIPPEAKYILYAPVDAASAFWALNTSIISNIDPTASNSNARKSSPIIAKTSASSTKASFTTKYVTVSFRAIADTGTTLLLTFSSVVGAYDKRVPSARLDEAHGTEGGLCSFRLG